MTIEEFTLKFSECFHQTAPETITRSTDFKALEEWGSMMALIVIAMVDADFGKTLTADDLKKSKTVSDLFEVVKGK